MLCAHPLGFGMSCLRRSKGIPLSTDFRMIGSFSFELVDNIYIATKSISMVIIQLINCISFDVPFYTTAQPER